MHPRRVSRVPSAALHELQRQRLLDVLRAHRRCPLILLLAPAGFGKSTLAAAYARASGAAVAWVSLTAAERDSRLFFTVLHDSLAEALGDPGVLPALRRGLEEGAEGVGVARLLVSDVAAISEPFLLVLDDFHAVDGAKEVLQALDVLLRRLPRTGQVVLTARELPPVSLDRLVATEAVLALGADDLRFTPQETAALRELLGGNASHDALAEGWVAGILLGGAPRRLGVDGGALLGAYVQREVLARLSRAEQRWLEALSVLETITPRAAQQLLGVAPWAARLAALAERCPFLVAGQDRSYRLHALVREALLARLRARSPAVATRAWSIARELAEATRNVPVFVRACQELGQTEVAVARVQSAVDDELRTGHWDLARGLVELLPPAVRATYPRLSLAEAWALLESGQPEAARAAAERALEQGGRSGVVEIQVRAALELAAIARWTGDLAAGQDWLDAADQWLSPRRLAPPVQRLLEGRSLELRGVYLAVRGQMEQARETLEAAERVLTPAGTTRELATVRANLGKLYAQVGDYPAAQAALTAAISQWRLIGDKSVLALTQTLLGNLYLRLGNVDAAGSVLAGALPVARKAGALRAEAFLMDSLGAWHRANGRLADAAASFDAALRLAEELGERELLVSTLRQRAELAVLQADWTLAADLLGRAQACAQEIGAGRELATIERAFGRAHLAHGRLRHALSCFEAALQQGGAAWDPDEQVTTLYWAATARMLLGEDRHAASALGQAVERLAQAGGGIALALAAAEDPRLFEWAVHAGCALDPAQVATVHRTLARRGPLGPVVAATALASAPGPSGERPSEAAAEVVAHWPRLQVRLFGAFGLVRDGVELAPSGGRPERASELLALLLLQPAGCSTREIAALLWPGVPAARAHHNLRMAAYVLRRQLGAKAALRHVGEAYQLESRLALWADVRVFDSALARARGGPPAAVRAELEEAIEVYRGPLLAGVDADWVATWRMAYQERAVAALLRLAELVADGDASDALAERVLALDPDHEGAFERLIANARQRRDRARLLRWVDGYVSAMRRLGIQPNPRLVDGGLPVAVVRH